MRQTLLIQKFKYRYLNIQILLILIFIDSNIVHCQFEYSNIQDYSNIANSNILGDRRGKGGKYPQLCDGSARRIRNQCKHNYYQKDAFDIR